MAQSLELNSGDEKVVLLELYTSEGCSSCPPADRWIAHFIDNPKLWRKIIPLSFHVDYWNYLGWKDEFADPEFSNRQRTHKQQGNLNGVYTPGILVDGKEWRGLLTGTPFPILSSEKPGNLKLQLDKDLVKLEFARASDKRLTAHLVFLGTGIENEIKSGENANRVLKHDFVVLEYQQRDSRNGKWQFDVTPTNESTAIAAWISNPKSQVPIQAIGSWLPE